LLLVALPVLAFSESDSIDDSIHVYLVQVSANDSSPVNIVIAANHWGSITTDEQSFDLKLVPREMGGRKLTGVRVEIFPQGRTQPGQTMPRMFIEGNNRGFVEAGTDDDNRIALEVLIVDVIEVDRTDFLAWRQDHCDPQRKANDASSGTLHGECCSVNCGDTEPPIRQCCGDAITCCCAHSDSCCSPQGSPFPPPWWPPNFPT
jgi:hypothetical protein